MMAGTPISNALIPSISMRIGTIRASSPARRSPTVRALQSGLSGIVGREWLSLRDLPAAMMKRRWPCTAVVTEATVKKSLTVRRKKEKDERVMRA